MPSTRPNTSITLAGLALATMAFSLLQSLVSPAMPDIQRELGASQTGIAWILTGYLLSAAVFTPIIGRLGDVHGKKRLMLVSLAALGGGALLAAVAQSLWLLVVARIIQGIGGGVLPLSFGIIRDVFPREKIAGAIGITSALLGLGGGVGVVLSGVIVDNLSYHWLFWFPLVGIVIAIGVVVFLIPESGQRAQASINWPGAALMSLGLAAVLFAVSRTSTWGWGSVNTIGLIAGGLAVLALWIRSEQRAASPLVDMRVMAIRGVWTTNLVAVLIGGSMFMGFILIPQFVQADPAAAGYGFGATVTQAGVFLLPMSLALLVVGALAGRIEQRLGSRAALLIGTVFSLAAFVVLLADHGSKAPIYVASGLLGVGIGLAFAAMANLIVQAVPQSQTGVATGMNTVARSVGGAFGSQLSATMLTASATGAGAAGALATVDGFEHAYAMAIVWLVLAFGAGLLIPGRRSQDDALAGPAATTDLSSGSGRPAPASAPHPTPVPTLR